MLEKGRGARGDRIPSAGDQGAATPALAHSVMTDHKRSRDCSASLVIQVFFHGHPGGQVDPADRVLAGAAASGARRLAAQLDHHQDGDADDQDPEEGVHLHTHSQSLRLPIKLSWKRAGANDATICRIIGYVRRHHQILFRPTELVQVGPLCP